MWARLAEGVRRALRAALLALVTGWVADVPGRLGLAFYNEQFLAAVIGIACAIVLTDPRPGHGRTARAASATLAGAMLALLGYVALKYPSLQLALVMAPPAAAAMGVVLIAGVLEATRRKTGPFLPVLVILLAAFAFVGPHLPAEYQTRPVGFSRLVVYLSLDTNALFGKVMEIAAVIVVPFIVFGFLLNAFGGSAFFSDLATAAVGRFRGGPAKVSVVGSAAFGMVSGSAVANVVTVGSVSIPMMARAGYRRPVAAAIEAVSSTGGQLMPPIMGASAFLMAELLELPYRSVVVAAILPSLFFYTALFLAVDFEARRLGLGSGDAGTRRGASIRGWRFLLPVGVLLYLLFVENRTAQYAGLMSVGALAAVHLAAPPGVLGARLRSLWAALMGAMGAITDIIMIAAAAGLIIGVLNVTGISFALTLQMLAVSGSSLALLLVLVGVLCIVLGLGMPTVGVYILLATLAAPALVELGVVPLAAHLYVLYFGMLSMITPPVAIASFAAASVAKTSPWQTSFASLRVGAGVYLVPVAFVLQPELLLIGGLADTIVAAARLLVAIALVSATAMGFLGRALSPGMRVAAAALAALGVVPLTGGLLDGIAWAGLGAGMALIVWLAIPGQGPGGAQRLARERGA